MLYRWCIECVTIYGCYKNDLPKDCANCLGVCEFRFAKCGADGQFLTTKVLLTGGICKACYEILLARKRMEIRMKKILEV